MLKTYPKLEKGSKNKKGEVILFYDNLPKKEKEELNEYLNYRKGQGAKNQATLKDILRYMLHVRIILRKPLGETNLRDLQQLMGILESSGLSGYARNDIKLDTKNYLAWKFPDSSKRFNNFKDVKLLQNPVNQKKINSQTMLKKEDIEEMMQHEQSLYWKAFLITQYEAGLRTIEARELAWKNIKFNVDGEISELLVSSRKTGKFISEMKTRPVFVKEATHYLKLLRDEQERTGKKGEVVFNSLNDINKPIDKSLVSRWMRGLSKKAGKYCWNYLLRHSRANELYTLSREGKMSKDNACDFLGHTPKVADKFYSHLDNNKIKELIKNQVYKLEELPPEQKAEFEKKLEELSKKQESLQADLNKRKQFDELLNKLFEKPEVLKLLK